MQKTSHDCFYKTSMEAVLEKLDLRPCRDKIVVTGIGSSNCVYHAVMASISQIITGIVPEDSSTASIHNRSRLRCTSSAPMHTISTSPFRTPMIFGWPPKTYRCSAPRAAERSSARRGHWSQAVLSGRLQASLLRRFPPQRKVSKSRSRRCGQNTRRCGSPIRPACSKSTVWTCNSSIFPPAQ